MIYDINFFPVKVQSEYFPNLKKGAFLSVYFGLNSIHTNYFQEHILYERTYFKRASSEQRPLKLILFGSRCPNEMIFGLGQL